MLSEWIFLSFDMIDNQTLRVWHSLKAFFKDRFNLKQDQERESVTKADIANGTVFKGANLWILMFAIIIASIGLNVNSTAVIIGAMLISPLMGPIMGIGLGVAVYDIPLVIKGARNLFIAVIISILTSTIYFLVTPLAEAQSELLSRTQPNIYDVLIAFSGGMAGIIAGSRKEKSNAIPGVAIATALMPPLCTAGYALATVNWYFFFGALYLFFINCVFISVSTFLIVRVLKYRKKKYENPRLERRVHSIVTVAVIITMVPSVLLAYNLVRKSVFERNAQVFMEREFNFPETQIIRSDVAYAKEGSTISVTLFGKLLPDESIEKIRASLPEYKLRDCDLTINQAYDDEEEEMRNVELISQNMRAGLIEDLYRKNEEVLQSKDERIKYLEDQLLKLEASQYPVADLSEELRVQYDQLSEFTVMDGYVRNMESNSVDTICFASVHFVEAPAEEEYDKIRRWLKLRLKVDSLRLITN